jgi:hypothetical protein
LSRPTGFVVYSWMLRDPVVIFMGGAAQMIT